MTKTSVKTFFPTRKTWLVASTVFISTGVLDMLQKDRAVRADETQSVIQSIDQKNASISPTVLPSKKQESDVFGSADSKSSSGKSMRVVEESEENKEASVAQKTPMPQVVQQSEDRLQQATPNEEREGDKTTTNAPSTSVIEKKTEDGQVAVATSMGKEPLPASDLIVSERNKRDLKDVARSIMQLVEEKLNEATSEQKGAYSSNPNNDPLAPLYVATKTSSYEDLVTELGNFLPNFAHPGQGQLDDNDLHVEKPGEMTFGVPDYAWFGYGGQQNDYSNVSYMRLVTDKSFVRQVADYLISIVGTPYKGTKTSYMPENKTLAYSGGFPFYAVIQSTNDSLLSPSYYFGQLNRTLQAVTNLFTLGIVDNELNNNYEDGQYGIYLRMAVPDGVDPNTFIKSLNLTKTKFGAQMDFNVNLSIDEVLNKIPGVRAMISSSVGLPISGYAGSIVDYLLSSVIAQINEKYATDLKVRGVDSPFYPITLYPKDIKTNVKEDPHGIYLLIRGAELKDFDSLYLRAKILLTKFFMNALSWGGNIVGGAYGYLNFDIDHYQGNMSSEEMATIYGKEQAQSKGLAEFADDSPFKILTRGQLPPQPDGRLNFALNSIDANAMLSKQSEYYRHGDIGRDIAVDRNKIHDNQMVTDSIATWRAYISPFDQKDTYNKKAVESSVAEFTEAKGMNHVLPGVDLDHRTIVLKPGETFYDERDRFDRVIDFFDGQVLVDKDGFHPNQVVQDVHLVKSVDPEGQRTKESDFAIYDRPFAVFYTGDMTLKNGQRIALRPTKITVTQPSDTKATALVSERGQAFNQLKKQMLFIQKTIECIRPKLADYHVIEFVRQLHSQLVEANLSLESAASSEEITHLTEAANREMVNIQDRAVAHHDLDEAVQQAARIIGQEQIEKEAFLEQLHIANAQLLSNKQQNTFNQAVHKTRKQVTHDLAKFDKRSKRSTDSLRDFLYQINKKTEEGIRAIRNVYIPEEVRKAAVQELADLVDQREKTFSAIPFVDPLSLKRQIGLLHANVDIFEWRIHSAVTREDIVADTKKGLAAIENVAMPTRLAGYNEATEEERQDALQTLNSSFTNKESAFSTIEHVDQQSLKQQLAIVEKYRNNSEAEIRSVKTKGELAAALKHGLDMLETVSEPELTLAYQKVDDIAKQNAKDAIREAAKAKQAMMRKVKHVASQSLVEQSITLQEIVKDSLAAIDQAQNKASLRDGLTKGLAAIGHLSDPLVDASYRKPAVTDQTEATKALESAFSDREKTFSELDGVDPTSLSKVLGQLKYLLNNALTDLKNADSVALLEAIYRRALQELNHVEQPIIIEGQQQADKVAHQKAHRKVVDQFNRKRKDFETIANVDDQSLAQQLKALDRLLKKQLATLDAARTKDDLNQTLQETLAKLDAIAQPKLAKGYQASTAEDQDNARVELETYGQQRKTAMAAITHVDANSLVEQQRMIDQILADYLAKLSEAKIQKDLRSIVQSGLASIEQTANPSVQTAYQPVDASRKQAAVDQLKQSILAKKKEFEGVLHVDQNSLKKQESFLDTLLSDAMKVIDRVEENGAVDQAVFNALAAIDKVAKPNLIDAYQAASVLAKDFAKQAIQSEGGASQASFKGIAHVNQKALAKQLALLDKAVKDAIQSVTNAQTRGEVQQAVQNGLAKIDAVQEPEVDLAYQPVSEQDRNKVIEAIDRATSHQEKDFEQIEHVDPSSLKAQKVLLEKVQAAAKLAVGQVNVQIELHELLQHALQELAAVPAPELLFNYQTPGPSSKQEATQQLVQVSDRQKNLFKEIEGVDEGSLTTQNGVIDQFVKQGMASINQATNNGELDQAFRDYLAAIQAVKAPSVREEKLAPTATSRQSAIQKLTKTFENTQNHFAAILHVNQKSLQEQLAILADVLQRSKEEVTKATTNGELAEVVRNGIANLANVSQPSLEEAYQPADQYEKNRAIAMVYQLIDQKKSSFNAIQHADPESLEEALKQLQLVEESIVQSIQSATTRGGINQSLSRGLTLLNNIAKPVIQSDYRAVDPDERQAANQLVRSAADQVNHDFATIPFVDKKALKLAVAEVKTILEEAIDKIATAVNKKALNTAVTETLNQIATVNQPGVDADHATPDPVQMAIYRQLLQTEALKKISSFDALAHTIQSSLKQQKRLVRNILAVAEKALAEAKNGAELNTVYQNNSQKIQSVAEPTLQKAYQAPQRNDFDKALAMLRKVAEARKQHFATIEHVDEHSLTEQNKRIDELVVEQAAVLAEAKTNLALDQTRRKAVQLIRQVPLPEVQKAMQKPTKMDRLSAKESLQQVVDNRKKIFKEKAHVDPVSLIMADKQLDNAFKACVDAMMTANTKGELTRLLANGLATLHNVAAPSVTDGYQPLTANAKQRAVQGLMNFVQEKRTSFEEIDGVDYQSLHEQTRLLKMAGAHAKANIDSLTKKQELVPAVTIGRQEILAVAEPELLQVYQAPKVEDLEQALSQLEMTGEERKTQFNELVHAKETARQQQKKQVDELVTEFESKMRVAQSNQTLNTLLLEGQDAIHHVALPALDDNFMPVKKSAINAAKQTIQQVAQQRTEEIKQLKEIDAESREDRLKQLDELVANYEPALALAQTVGELRRTTDIVESLIRLFADPERQVKEQEKPVTPEVPVSPVKPVEPITPKAPADSAIPVTPSNESDSPSQASGEDAKRPSNENRVVPADDFNEPTFVNHHLASSPKAKALTGNKVQQNAIPHSLGIRAADYPVRNESTVTEKMFADQSSKSSKEGRHPLPETAKESNPNQMVKRTFLALLLSMLPFVKGRLRQKD